MVDDRSDVSASNENMVQPKKWVGRVLVASSDFPLPLDTGGRRDIYERIATLNSFGFIVDVVATTWSEVEVNLINRLRNVAAEVTIVKRTNWLKDVFSRYPAQYSSRAALSAIPLKYHYDIVILEREFMGAILENPTLNASRIVLRVHDNAEKYYRNLAKASSSPIYKLFYHLESRRLQGYSSSVFAKSDRLWFISSREMLEYLGRHSADDNKSAFLPVIVNSKRFRSAPLAGKSVLYIGGISIPINTEAIMWYLTNVHPLLCTINGYEFVLAGKTDGKIAGRLQKLIDQSEKVVFYPDPEDIGPLYMDASVFVNPIQNGAGLKIKTIDAAIEGLPIVSTSVGVEGSGFEHRKHAVVADDPQGFADAVAEVLENKPYAHQLVSSARQYLAERYSEARFAALIDDVMPATD